MPGRPLGHGPNRAADRSKSLVAGERDDQMAGPSGRRRDSHGALDRRGSTRQSSGGTDAVERQRSRGRHAIAVADPSARAAAG
jgi:hypothetical protein